MVTRVQTLSQIKLLLEERGLSPKKALGQNFLVDHNLIRRLVDASGVGEGDQVLEVGPGTGALTTELLERGCSVIASELDTALSQLLRDTLGRAYPDRFTLIEGDCLESKRELSRAVADALGGRAFTLVANLPYHAATPLMLALLTRRPECSGLHVTIQREVGDRLTAKPSTKTYGSISVVAQHLCDVSLVAKLPPECFWPRPDVTSVMVSLVRRSAPGGAREWGRLADTCQTLFASRRKQLRSVVKRVAGQAVPLPDGIEASARVESLTPGQIVALVGAIASCDGDAPNA